MDEYTNPFEFMLGEFSCPQAQSKVIVFETFIDMTCILPNLCITELFQKTPFNAGGMTATMI